MMLAQDAVVSDTQAESRPVLDIRLFGTPGVEVAGKPLPPLRSRKGLYLLALLALPPGRERDRAYLAGRLWPDSEESLALANLRRALTDLKSALGVAADCISSPSPRSLRLEADGRVRVDVASFDGAVARGGGSEDVAAMDAAVRAYGGPLMEGDEEEWVYPERLGREQAYIATLERLAATRRGLGDYIEATRLYRLIVAAEPMRESAHRGLMEVLARSGNFAEAQEAYRALRIVLRRELNADPDPETRALYDALREQARQPPGAGAGRAAPENPTPVPRGGDAASAAFPEMPGVAAATGPLRLPSAVSAFIGRRAELGSVAELLSGYRLVTLVGAGGVGKTRLSVEAARRAAPDFPDGVFFADLAQVADAARVAQAVAAALEVPDGDGGASPQEALLRAMETRRAMIVLDNCEHVLAECGALATQVLRRCPDVRLLATSRQPLGIGGEAVWRVPPLSVPDPGALVEGDAEALSGLLGAHDATRLFVARATSVSPHFAASGRQGLAIVDVCRRLDGIALAIELAAARVRVLTVEQIAERLDDRFRLLTGGDRSALPRQQTLRALIDWSWDLLPEAERVLLARLSVFAGGWTLEAAERVCPGGEGRFGATDVLDLLSELVDKSLVLFDDTRAAEVGAGRYRMQETIRQYAAQRLAEAAGDAADLRDRHLAYYAGEADRGEHELTGADQVLWGEFFAREQANLRAAWEWAASRGDHDRVLLIPAASWRHQRACGLMTQGRAWLEEALGKGESGASPAMRKRAHTSAGNLALVQGDYAEARRHIEAVIAVSRETGDEFGVALGGTNLGILAEMGGDHERARALLEEHLPFFRRTSRLENLATALYNLSIIHDELGDRPASRAAIEECLELRRRLDDRRGIANALNHVAVMASEEGDAAAALTHIRECLVIARGLGHRMTEATALSTLGSIALRRGSLDAARASLGRSLAMFREMESAGDLVIVLESFAALAERSGERERAARLFGAVSALREKTGFRGLGGDDRADVRDRLRTAMGADRYDALAREGAAFDRDQAATYALEVVPADAPADPLDML